MPRPVGGVLHCFLYTIGKKMSRKYSIPIIFFEKIFTGHFFKKGKLLLTFAVELDNYWDSIFKYYRRVGLCFVLSIKLRSTSTANLEKERS